MSTTPVQLDAVLHAALRILAARQDQMLTIEERADLARAAAACNGCKAADLLTERDLADIAGRSSLDWHEETDGALPTFDEE